ncbi:MAG TPA: hypothetical protein VIK91_02440, partial [Nannocystis sp.]
MIRRLPPLVFVCACSSPPSAPAPEAGPGSEPAPRAEIATPPPAPEEVKAPVEGALAETPARGMPPAARDRLGAPIYGHVLVPRPEQWLAEIREQIVPPRYAEMVTPKGLLGLLVVAVGMPTEFAEKLDLTRPLGCVIGDLSPEPQVACVLGYRGGAQVFAQDLGGAREHPGHVAMFEVESVKVYVDALGPDVALSLDDGTFKATSAYIERNLVGGADRVRTDVEAVVFPDYLFERHGETLMALADEPEERTAKALREAKGEFARKLAEAQADHERRTNRSELRKLKEYSEIAMYVDLADGHLALGARVLPRPGGRFPAESLNHGRRLDFEFVGRLPAEVLAIFAYDLDPYSVAAVRRSVEGFITEEDVQDAITSVALYWAAVAGGPEAAYERRITDELREARALYAGPAAWALVTLPEAPLAFLGVRRLLPGASGREAWRAWAARMGERPQGPVAAKGMKWSFHPAAWTLDGAEVDRWTIELLEADLQEARAALFGNGATSLSTLHIDRLEHEGDVYYVIAPGAEEAVLRRALAARAGKGKLGDT